MDIWDRIFLRFVRYVNRKSVYPLVLGSWQKARTPDILQAVIDTEFFPTRFQTIKPDISRVKNVLVFAPHQDDEAIGCGGLLIKLRDQASITVIFMTDGAQRSLGVSQQDSVKLRNAEADKALSYCNGIPVHLALPNKSLEFSELFVERLVGCLRRLPGRPDLILTPWLFDRPHKHRVCNAILLEAIEQVGGFNNVPMWGYQVHNCLFPNVVIDISEEMPEKLEMIRCYPSQLENVGAYDHFISGMNQWNARYCSSGHRGYAEVYTAFPVREWLGLYKSVIKPNMATYSC